MDSIRRFKIKIKKLLSIVKIMYIRLDADHMVSNTYTNKLFFILHLKVIICQSLTVHGKKLYLNSLRLFLLMGNEVMVTV